MSLTAHSSRGLLERLFAVDREEHRFFVRALLGVPMPLLLFAIGPLLGAPGSALMWFVSSTTVFLAGWLGGFVSGSVATFLAAAIMHRWLLPAHEHMAQLLAFVAAGLLVSLLHGQLRATVRKLDGRRRAANAQTKQLEQTRAQLELALSQLEERVSERTAALLDALLRAEAATHAKAAFLRNISHELRTPLNPILGFTHLLAQTITDPEQRLHLQHIDTGGRRLLGLVTNLIELTRSSPDEAAPTALDLRATIDAVIDTYRLAADDKGLRVGVQIDPAIPQGLTGDALRVASVLEQLLGNAIKFSTRGCIELRSMLAREGPGFVCVRFEVQDEGIGIAPDMQPHIFDAFRQVRDDALARSDGLGIGLALAKRAVERLDGEIGVHSAPGAGSTFWFTARFLLEPQFIGPETHARLYG